MDWFPRNNLIRHQARNLQENWRLVGDPVRLGRLAPFLSACTFPAETKVDIADEWTHVCPVLLVVDTTRKTLDFAIVAPTIVPLWTAKHNTMLHHQIVNTDTSMCRQHFNVVALCNFCLGWRTNRDRALDQGLVVCKSLHSSSIKWNTFLEPDHYIYHRFWLWYSYFSKYLIAEKDAGDYIWKLNSVWSALFQCADVNLDMMDLECLLE